MTELPKRHDARSICAIANALEIIGDRWTLLVIRDLMFTNRSEFGHLLNSGEGISTNILAERLLRLQEYHIIEKLPHPSHGKKYIYQLTEKGMGLAPVLVELMLWALNNIEQTFVPPSVFTMMVNDKETLCRKISNREAIVKIDL